MYGRQLSPAKGVPPSPSLTKGISQGLLTTSLAVHEGSANRVSQGGRLLLTPPDVVYIFNFNLLKLVITQE